MRIQYKHQKFQADAAKAVVDVFAGQPYMTPTYMMDRGTGYHQMTLTDERDFTGWSNSKIIPELNLYTWEDANLKELAKFIHDALKETMLGMYDLYQFSRIHYDSDGTLLRDYAGSVVINDKKSKFNKNNKTSLKEIGFQIGDYFDINITSVNRKK